MPRPRYDDDYEPPPRQHYHHQRGGLRTGFGMGMGCVLGTFFGFVLLCAGGIYLFTKSAEGVRELRDRQEQQERQASGKGQKKG